MDLSKSVLGLLQLCVPVSFCLGMGAPAPDEAETRKDGPPPGKGYEMVWNDEFNGAALDLSKWSYRLGPRNDAVWTKDAVQLDGKGFLHLTTTTNKETGAISQGAIVTDRSFYQRYGYFEARIKLPAYKGHWLGFWIQSSRIHRQANEIQNPAYCGTEIDILETFWPQQDILCSNIHWGGYSDKHPVRENIYHVKDLYKGFHNFGLEWFPDRFVYYIDGEKVFERRADVSQIPEFIYLSEECKLEVWKKSGNIPKDYVMPDDDSVIDWVRVYQIPYGFKGYESERKDAEGRRTLHLIKIETSEEGSRMLANDVRSIGKVLALPGSKLLEVPPIKVKAGEPPQSLKMKDEGIAVEIKIEDIDKIPYFNWLKISFPKGGVAEAQEKAPEEAQDKPAAGEQAQDIDAARLKERIKDAPSSANCRVRIPAITNCWVAIPDVHSAKTPSGNVDICWLYWLSE